MVVDKKILTFLQIYYIRKYIFTYMDTYNSYPNDTTEQPQNIDIPNKNTMKTLFSEGILSVIEKILCCYVQSITK